MRTFNTPQVSRPAPIDRNPDTTIYAGNLDLGAGSRAATVDTSRTVPAGKKAKVGGLSLNAMNNSATATNAKAGYQFRMTPDGGSTSVVYQAVVPTGAASYKDTVALGEAVEMLPGDAFDLRSWCDNTAAGSDVELDAAVQFMEYDA